MKFLKFMFTARLIFVLFALLAFVLTVLYLGWSQKHQGAVLNHPGGAIHTR